MITEVQSILFCIRKKNVGVEKKRLFNQSIVTRKQKSKTKQWLQLKRFKRVTEIGHAHLRVVNFELLKVVHVVTLIAIASYRVELVTSRYTE